MLTISELANLVGVTPRAIRHYHRLGLLDEPPRRANGYRSYGPAEVIRLTRIRRMQDVGLGLREIGRLLNDEATPEPGGAREALLALDEDLARQQRELSRRRERIAELLAGPADLTLPPELAELLERLAAADLDAALVAAERDALALIVALHPEQIPGLVRLYRAALDDDTGLAVLGRRFADLAGAAPDDPAVADLAKAFAAALRRLGPPGDEMAAGAYPVLQAFLDENLSPAQRRCAQLVGEAFS